MTPHVRYSMILAFALLLIEPAEAAEDRCFSCHDGIGDKVSTLFKKDVHFSKGLSCASCHGGNAREEDMEKAMSKAAGFIGVPKGDEISRACAKCHADAGSMKSLRSSLPTNQMELLTGSVHGSLATSGKEHILQCTSCHNAHGIARVKDPASPVHPLNVVRTCTKCHASAAYMKTYNPALPVDQLEKYRTSVHGIRNAKGDPKTAECVSCHESHGILRAKDVRSSIYPTNLPATCARCHSDASYMKEYGIPVDQFEKYSRSVHGVALLQKHDAGAPACNSCHGNHGATPPGVASISKVCGTCHALNADLFSASPHKKAFDAMGLPECETCHGNHEIVAASNTLLGIGANAVCSRCHTPDKRQKGYATAASMRRLIDSVETMESRARATVQDAEQKGMEIAEAKFKLRDVRQAQMEARTVVHAFDMTKFKQVADKGLTTAAGIQAEAQAAVDDYYFRRIGLGIATLIVTMLALSLYLYIRRLEARQKAAAARADADR